MSNRRIEFTPPQGAIPEGVKDGEDFDLVCTFRVKGSQVCLVMIGDTKMPGYGDKERDKGKPSYADEHKAMMSAGEQSQGAVGYQTGYA